METFIIITIAGLVVTGVSFMLWTRYKWEEECMENAEFWREYHASQKKDDAD